MRQVKPPGAAKTGQLSGAAEIIGKAQEAPPVPIEISDTNSAVNNNNMNPSTTDEWVLDGITQDIETEAARAESESPPHCIASDVVEETLETAPISEMVGGQSKLPPCQLPQSMSQQLEAATEGPESPPYEPFLEVKNDYESPPYEPSLGFEEGAGSDLRDKMDIDVSDAEEGEIMEVDMEVDSDDDDVMQDSLPITSIISKGKTPEPLEVPWGTQWKDKSQPLTSTTIQSTILPPKPPSPISAMVPVFSSEERVNRPDPATVNANDTTTSTVILMPSAKVSCSYPRHTLSQQTDTCKVIPNVFIEYESPLRQFRSYRYHPQYLKMVEGGWRSLTFSNRIDPDKLFCVYEISGGKCNDTSCDKQHFRQIALSGAY